MALQRMAQYKAASFSLRLSTWPYNLELANRLLTSAASRSSKHVQQTLDDRRASILPRRRCCALHP